MSEIDILKEENQKLKKQIEMLENVRACIRGMDLRAVAHHIGMIEYAMSSMSPIPADSLAYLVTFRHKFIKSEKIVKYVND